jgi:hypothetical protein
MRRRRKLLAAPLFLHLLLSKKTNFPIFRLTSPDIAQHSVLIKPGKEKSTFFFSLFNLFKKFLNKKKGKTQGKIQCNVVGHQHRKLTPGGHTAY